MKKLFVGLAVVVGSMSFAQQFGIKAGANISSISKDGFEDTKSKVGFNAGVFMNAPLSEQFSIQPEVMYSQMGSKVNFTDNASATLKLDYITVPVMFQFNATPQFYLEAGPEFGFLVSSKAKGEVNGNTQTVDLDKDNFNSFNMGAGLGLGFNFNKNIGINARYVAGFTDINKDGETSLNNEKHTNRNNTFQVGLNYKF
ncbi:outer membrane insertion C-terminal signal [Soonwooa buanensis]|uniref:Outer membrane insertion C-terminal signal n=1 Tax=Soonwooa buanensis TaxID=619805 RepID=A0A1T5F1D7_9FLAO|nr:porin family protein [Soonwooa buanensis]SKB90017.1 outer membrane insertion C-terminal signal [Soonwooa buanensis]